jgi:hypothetical protein
VPRTVMILFSFSGSLYFKIPTDAVIFKTLIGWSKTLDMVWGNKVARSLSGDEITISLTYSIPDQILQLDDLLVLVYASARLTRSTRSYRSFIESKKANNFLSNRLLHISNRRGQYQLA